MKLPHGVYYNEWDPYCYQWLLHLMKKGLIPAGDADERDIRDVPPEDLKPYRECHFFAGIGTWAYVCRKTNASRDVRSLWTASLPCQPFSEAGRRAGFADERHLWRSFHWLVRFGKPELLFGEQVASSGGKAWLEVVQSDLEAGDYCCGAVVLPACSVGAPHRRNRIYWVAKSKGNQQKRTALEASLVQRTGPGAPLRTYTWPDGYGAASNVDIQRLLSSVDGAARRLEQLRTAAYGNAIVAPLAIEFVWAALRVMP